MPEDSGTPKYSAFPNPEERYGPGKENLEQLEKRLEKRRQGERVAKQFPAWALIFIGLYNVLLGIFKYDFLWVGIGIGAGMGALGYWWLRRIRSRLKKET